MEPYTTLYYIGHGNLIGPLTLFSYDDFISASGGYTQILRASDSQNTYLGERKDFKTANQLINTPIWIDGKIATIIVKIDRKEVTVPVGRYGCYIFDLSRVSLRPDEKLLLTKESDQGKIQEMNTETKNPFFELSEAFVKFTNSLAEKLENYNAANRKFSESPKIGETFSLTLKDGENFQNLHAVAAQPNKKILVLEHKRFLLNSALSLAPGTKIDILRADDSRVYDKNYDLVIS